MFVKNQMSDKQKRKKQPATTAPAQKAKSRWRNLTPHEGLPDVLSLSSLSSLLSLSSLHSISSLLSSLSFLSSPCDVVITHPKLITLQPPRSNRVKTPTARHQTERGSLAVCEIPQLCHTHDADRDPLQKSDHSDRSQRRD